MTRSEPLFESLPRRNLRDEAAAQLRGQIIAGSLTPGVIYSMSAIAAQLGVSATPVREAVLELAKEELVEMVQNRGFRVRVATGKELDDIVEIRLTLEVPAMGRLADLRPEPELEKLRPMAEELVEHAANGDMVAFVVLDSEFHLSLTALLGNPRYVELVRVLRYQTRLSALPKLRGAAPLVESAREHVRLLDLLAAGDRPGAEALMTTHVNHARGLWAGRPEDDGPVAPDVR
ncbi:GntR family transcriptional regulator [Nonomuraea sp. B10E15]|uniref:GntR family transcriptional regulator n=1 Tax=Nonomuraea sp. B10E15 TaxID=3153560 RepID=UPI00325E1550